MIKKIILYSLIFVSLIPAISQAQDYKLLEPLPCIEGTGINCVAGKTIDSIDFNDYISYIFKFAIALSVFLAVIMTIVGGLKYMTSGTPFGKGDGKTMIQDAAVGLLMVLASYLILQTIDPRLVEVNTTIPPIRIDTGDAKAFSDRLSEDLKKLTSEKQLKIVELENRKVELEREKKSIENELLNLNSSADAGNYEKRDEIEVRLAKVRGEIEKTDIEQTKTIAEGLGNSSFRIIHEAIKAPEQTNAGELEKYKNKIRSDFDTRINSISDKDSETAKVLEKQRDFYIKEIDDEIILKKDLSALKMDGATYTQIERGLNKNLEILLNKEKQYKSDITNEEKIKSSGLDRALYINIVQGKINDVVEVRKELISKSKKAAEQMNVQDVNVPGI